MKEAEKRLYQYEKELANERKFEAENPEYKSISSSLEADIKAMREKITTQSQLENEWEDKFLEEFPEI